MSLKSTQSPSLKKDEPLFHRFFHELMQPLFNKDKQKNIKEEMDQSKVDQDSETGGRCWPLITIGEESKKEKSFSEKNAINDEILKKNIKQEEKDMKFFNVFQSISSRPSSVALSMERGDDDFCNFTSYLYTLTPKNQSEGWNAACEESRQCAEHLPSKPQNASDSAWLRMIKTLAKQDKTKLTELLPMKLDSIEYFFEKWNEKGFFIAKAPDIFEKWKADFLRLEGHYNKFLEKYNKDENKTNQAWLKDALLAKTPLEKYKAKQDPEHEIPPWMPQILIPFKNKEGTWEDISLSPCPSQSLIQSIGLAVSNDPRRDSLKKYEGESLPLSQWSEYYKNIQNNTVVSRRESLVLVANAGQTLEGNRIVLFLKKWIGVIEQSKRGINTNAGMGNEEDLHSFWSRQFLDWIFENIELTIKEAKILGALSSSTFNQKNQKNEEDILKKLWNNWREQIKNHLDETGLPFNFSVFAMQDNSSDPRLSAIEQWIRYYQDEKMRIPHSTLNRWKNTFKILDDGEVSSI